MFSLKKMLIKEGQFQIYHNSYTAAVNTALKYAEKRGYEYDKTDTFNIIGLGPKKPSDGKMNRLSIPLLKNEEPQREQLHIQVYGMGEGRYELNAYIA
jgi:hypothetical protein